jgi:hypothetical protein
MATGARKGTDAARLVRAKATVELLRTAVLGRSSKDVRRVVANDNRLRQATIGRDGEFGLDLTSGCADIAESAGPAGQPSHSLTAGMLAPRRLPRR